jgi:hypothetical protein
MFRVCILAVALVGILVTDGFAIIVLYLDEIDDMRIIHAVANVEKVKVSRQELLKLETQLLKLKRPDLEALLGKPADKPAKSYAMPVGERRSLALPGLRDANDKRPENEFVGFHPLGDFGAVEIYYSRYKTGDTPLAVRFYLKVDKTFLKLTKDNLEQRLEWEQERLKKVVGQIGKEKEAGLGGTDVTPIAVGDWSRPVENLRGRLLVAQGRVLGDRKTRETVAYVELQNVSGAGGEPLNVYFDPRLQNELRDPFDKLVPQGGVPGSGGRPGLCWVTLPYDSTMRLRVSPYGFGRSDGLLIPMIDNAWFIAADDPGDYSLSATFTVRPPLGHGRDRAWQGTLALPKTKISVKGK